MSWGLPRYSNVPYSLIRNCVICLQFSLTAFLCHSLFWKDKINFNNYREFYAIVWFRLSEDTPVSKILSQSVCTNLGNAHIQSRIYLNFYVDCDSIYIKITNSKNAKYFLLQLIHFRHQFITGLQFYYQNLYQIKSHFIKQFKFPPSSPYNELPLQVNARQID